MALVGLLAPDREWATVIATRSCGSANGPARVPEVRLRYLAEPSVLQAVLLATFHAHATLGVALSCTAEIGSIFEWFRLQVAMVSRHGKQAAKSSKVT
jgi:hypothetical protein